MSFGAVAADYDRLRPGPPPEAIDWLLPAHPDVVVDLAAGTGLLTRALASKAAPVIAIEPDERMRAVLAAHTHGVQVLAGRGEAIPLPDASADGVFVSSAWHWMDSGPGDCRGRPGPAGRRPARRDLDWPLTRNRHGCAPTTGSPRYAPRKRRRRGGRPLPGRHLPGASALRVPIR